MPTAQALRAADWAGVLPPRYRLESVLSERPACATLEVFDGGLRQAKAVIKVQLLAEKEEGSDRIVQQFEEFCRTTGSIQHPYVSAPYTHGILQTPGGPVFGYTTRPYENGQTLAELDRKLDESELVRVAQHVCSGLDALHSGGTCHLDLKLENVVVRRGSSGRIDELSECVLIDLIFRPDRDIDAPALSEVTLQYVSPELLEGDAEGGATDLYALGVMLYRLASGHFPFTGTSLPQIMHAQKAKDFVALSELRPDLSPRFLDTVGRLLEPNPEHRPASAEAVVAELDVGDASAQYDWSHALAGGFVGRQSELRACLEALGQTKGGVTVFEITGPSGSGITTLMREAQDQLETSGVAVLTAQPRAVAGASLADQLRGPVEALARRTQARTEVPADRRVRRGNHTELLDDLFVATQGLRVVFFIDDWRSCDVSELLLLRRIILQDRAVLEGVGSRRGRCQVVLGAAHDAAPSVAAQEIEALVESRIVLAGLSHDAIAALLRRRKVAQQITRAQLAQIESATGGLPGPVIAVMGLFVQHCVAGKSAEEALVAATQAVASQAAHRPYLRAGLDRLRAAPDGDAHLALLLWNDALTEPQWAALAAQLGTEGAEPSARFAFVEETAEGRRIHPKAEHLHLTTVLAPEESARLATALLTVLHDTWRSRDPRQLVPLLRVAALRPGRPRWYWHACRALIILLNAGRAVEVESIAGRWRRTGSAPWWVPLFEQAARVNAGRCEALRGPADVALPMIRSDGEFLTVWLRGRALLRARYTRDAYRALKPLLGYRSLLADLTRAALLEDYGWCTAETGLVDETVDARKQYLKREGRWLYVLRRPSGRGPHLGKACRKLMGYFRLRFRVHFATGALRRAAKSSRRERILSRGVGNVEREAACLNNEGLSYMKRGVPQLAASVLERCAAIREKLDDEQGLVGTLLNLAAAMSRLGRLGSAAGVLNRTRVIATRNGLSRHRNLALLNLGLAYAKRGQLRDARKVWRRVRRFSREDGDIGLLARATYNCAHAACETGNMALAAAYLTRLRQLREANAEYPASTNPDLITAQIAVVTRDMDALDVCLSRMRRGGFNPPELAVLDQVVELSRAGDLPAKLQHERSYSTDARLQLLLLRRRARGGRVRFWSVRRVLRFADAEALIREALQWIVAHVASEGINTDQSLALGLRALSRFEYREGHDDLQIELRAHLAYALRKRGRGHEAWRLFEDALVIFRRLERKLSRVRSAPVLVYLHRLLRLAMRDGGELQRSASQRLSESLCADAFVALMAARRGRVHDSAESFVARIGGILTTLVDADRFIEDVLHLGVETTGAQRAILIRGRERERRIDKLVVAEDFDERKEELSWAVATQVLVSGEPCLYSDALTSEELASHRSIAVLRLRSLACLPVRVGNETVAALYLDHHGIAGLFNEEHLPVLRVLAGLIGNALQTARASDRAAKQSAELQETQKHILRAERNRVSGEIASGLVHDLKNVLTAVSGRAQLLRQYTDDARILHSAAAIERAAGSGASLIQRLQECSREHSLQTEELVDLRAVAQEAVDLLALHLEKHEVLATVTGDSGALVKAVPGEFRELFLNLLMNACDAMPEGGSATIEVRVDAQQREIAVNVADTGCGMPEEVRRRIFEPFFTTKGRRGTGLGLVIVQSTVVRHGGAVAVESAPGEGTTFRIRLPLRS